MTDSKDDQQSVKISKFGGSIISGSAKDLHCKEHDKFETLCKDCQEGRALVEKYQSYKHTFTCKKKGKVIRILSSEGHGRLDGVVEKEMLLVPFCRFDHPKNPID